MDDHHRNHHDCYGTGKYLWRQNGGQVAQSGQALWTYHRSCFMDCVNSRGRKIYHCWHFCGSDFSVNNNFLILAAFVACMVIFVFPLFLLGTVTPSLVKYSVSNLDDNGKTVGTLGAFNTIGSIIGTFVPTFVTIPAVGTSITFLIFAGILLALSIVYFVMEKAGKRK